MLIGTERVNVNSLFCVNGEYNEHHIPPGKLKEVDADVATLFPNIQLSFFFANKLVSSSCMITRQAC